MGGAKALLGRKGPLKLCELYFANTERVYRLRLDERALVPQGPAEIVVDGCSPNGSWHNYKIPVIDGAGNLYVATDNRVRKVDVVTGVITTFAGIGERAVEGDGGLATNAGLAEPVGLALDSQGNLFIADRDNHRVRKVDASTHMISTVAGQGKFAARLGNIYSLGNTTDRPLNRESAQGAGYSGDDGPAIEARLSVPSSIAFGPEGDLFIADGGVHVRRVDSSSGVITTVASSETVSSTETGKVQIYTTVIGRIVSIVVNDLNEIFLADFKKSVVHKVSKSTSSP